MRHRAFELQDYIGGTVISRSGDEEEPLKKGTLVRYEDHHSGSALPIVKFDDGKEYLCFTSLLPYTDALWKMLEPMTAQEQLDEIVHLNHFTLANARRCRGNR
jgi:hypothetical protein